MRYVCLTLALLAAAMLPARAVSQQTSDDNQVSAAIAAGRAALPQFESAKTVIAFTADDEPLVRSVAAALGLPAVPNGEVVPCEEIRRVLVCRLRDADVVVRLVHVAVTGDSAVVVYEGLSPAPAPMLIHHRFATVHLSRGGEKWVVTGRGVPPVN